MTRGWKIGLAVGGVLVLGGIGAGIAKKRQPKVTEVTLGKVEKKDVVSKVTANGKIQAEQKVDLSALVMGQIVSLVVHEGDPVKSGAFLLQIDPNRAAADERGSQAALEAALADLGSSKSALDQAEREYDRAKRNYDASILPIADYQRAQSALETARAARESARHRVDQLRAGVSASRDTLSKMTVKAPIDGVVTALRVKLGEVTVLGTMNNPGTQLMTISDMSSVLAVLMVDETDMPTVAVGQKAVLTLDSYPGRTFAGEVVEAGQSPIARDDADLQGLTTTSDAINFKVRVKMTDPPPSIRPGFSVTADIITGTRKGVLAVPLAAIVVRDAKSGERTVSGKLKTEEGVYRTEAEKKKVVWAPVELGIAGELQIEVAKGLEEGQEIVIGPFQALRELEEGDLVKAKPEDKKKRGAGSSAKS